MTRLSLRLAAAVLALMATGCRHEAPKEVPATAAAHHGEIDWKATDRRWNWLSFYQVKTGEPIAMLPVPGRVAPLESATWALQAPLSGRVETANVRVGQEVHQGDRLVLVRSSLLTEMRREQVLARQTLNLRQNQARHAQTLSEAHAIAEKDLLAAQQDLRAADLDLKTITSKLAALNVETAGESLYWLRAPKDGVIVKADVTPGQETGPEGQPLMVLAGAGKVVVWAQMMEGDLDGIRQGDKADVLSPGRDEHTVARVESISQAVDPEQHTVAVRLVSTETTPWLRPNGYVQVVFHRRQGQALVVPSEAVVTDDLQSVVFVKGSDGRLSRRPVSVGLQSNNQAEIVKGVVPGETIVSKGAILLLNEVEP